MSHKRLASFVVAALTGLASGLSGTVLADDTDIYLSGTGGGQDIVRPNVLFVLDTSDSMNRIVDADGDGINDPEEVSRLENMRDAMVGLIQDLDNVNVGFMRFNGRRQRIDDCAAAGLTDPWYQSAVAGGECYLPTGGPVLYPVKNLDALNADTTGETDAAFTTLRYQVSQSSDDAEELNLSGEVITSDLRLELIGRKDYELLTPIRAGADDAVQGDPGIAADLDNQVLRLDDDDYVGFLFRDIAVPAGSRINQARLRFVSDANDDTVFVNPLAIQGLTDTTDFSETLSDLENRVATATSALVKWTPPPWLQGESYTANTTTPELSAVAQELIDDPGWVEGGDLGFLIYEAFGDASSGGNREIRAFEKTGTTDDVPVLFLSYEIDTETQRVGVRFQDVQIPQGATVTGAYLDFTTDDPSSNTPTASLSVQIEESSTPATFSATTGNVSARSWSASSVSWTPEQITTEVVDIDEVATEVPSPSVLSTPNLASLVQQVVDRGDWCGGKDMAFSIVGTGTRAVRSYDFDPTAAPVLRVTYDATTIPAGGGCVESRQVYQAENDADDGYELAKNGAVTKNGAVLLAYKGGRGASQVTTLLRFPGIAVDPDATVLSAHIEFTAAASTGGDITLTFKGDASGNALQVNEVKNNITDTAIRPRTSASITWSPPDWVDGQVYRSADLASVVQEAISSGNGWSPNNALGFYITGNTTNGRGAYSFNLDPLKAPRLILNVETSQEATAGGKTVRERIIELVNEHSQGLLSTLNRTPSVETLYEAAQYWTGGPVIYGRKRGTQEGGTRGSRVTRVSHPGSWTGGTLERPAGCTDQDLSAEACKDEVISGDPQYVSPFGEEECQSNFMIFLSDGAPTQNGAIGQVEDFIGGSCGENAMGTRGQCAYELVNYLKNNDLDSSIAGEQSVTTYTIGFNIGDVDNVNTVTWMQDIAAQGGGQFFPADTAGQLKEVLQSIFTDILSNTTSYASPALSVNAFNKLFNRDDVYFALFRPTIETRWEGNVKKYKICSNPAGADGTDGTGDDCVLGEVLDATGASAIGDDSRILGSALSLWTDGGADGPAVEKGGAGAEIPLPANRTVYTDIGLTSPSGSFGDGTAAGTALDASADTLLNAANYQTNTAVRAQACADPTEGNTNCDNVLEWVLGYQIAEDDQPRTSGDSQYRWAFNDPLHSSPIIVNYGGTEAAPIEKLFVGTNEGGLRMINASTGAEEWVFVPDEFLGNGFLSELINNPDGDHRYGLDLTPVVRTNDTDGDGVIEPADGDFVHVFIAQRRGGRALYALNVTPANPITTQDTGLIVPRFMWRIEGGVTPDYERLGYTFSRPLLTNIRFGTGGQNAETRAALIFGGGYDLAVDDAYGTTGTSGAPNIGNAIYIVDPEDGGRTLWISHAAAADGSYAASGADIELAEMVHSIPSDVAGMDSNGDGETDRLYVGDTGGNVWRVDLGETLSTGSPGGSVVGRLADLGNLRGAADPDGANERKFFYPPDVVQVKDTIYSTAGRYDLVVITSGDRANPLANHVVNRIYALRDYDAEGFMADADGNAIADAPAELTNGDLLNVTQNLLQTGSDAEQEAELTALQAADGWYIDLLEPPSSTKRGEKGLSAPIILAGKVFITTFLPDATLNPCTASEGAGRIWALNVLNAEALDEWGLLDSTKTHGARANVLGAGIPSGAVPIFQEKGVTLLIGTGGGASVVDPNIQLPRERTYWFQEED